jgi:hypothetical protein
MRLTGPRHSRVQGLAAVRRGRLILRLLDTLLITVLVGAGLLSLRACAPAREEKVGQAQVGQAQIAQIAQIAQSNFSDFGPKLSRIVLHSSQSWCRFPEPR